MKTKISVLISLIAIIGFFPGCKNNSGGSEQAPGSLPLDKKNVKVYSAAISVSGDYEDLDDIVKCPTVSCGTDVSEISNAASGGQFLYLYTNNSSSQFDVCIGFKFDGDPDSASVWTSGTNYQGCAANLGGNKNVFSLNLGKSASGYSTGYIYVANNDATDCPNRSCDSACLTQADVITVNIGCTN